MASSRSTARWPGWKSHRRPVGDDGADQRRQRAGTDAEPFFSPDGGTVFFSATATPAASGSPTTSRRPRPSLPGSPTELSQVSGQETNDDYAPSVAPDGRTVVFDRNDVSLDTLDADAPNPPNTVCSLYTPAVGLAAVSDGQEPGDSSTRRIRPSSSTSAGTTTCTWSPDSRHRQPPRPQPLRPVRGPARCDGYRPRRRRHSVTGATDATGPYQDKSPTGARTGQRSSSTRQAGAQITPCGITSVTSGTPTVTPLWPSQVGSGQSLKSATGPVYSPDGTFVAFVEPGQGQNTWTGEIVGIGQGLSRSRGVSLSRRRGTTSSTTSRIGVRPDPLHRPEVSRAISCRAWRCSSAVSVWPTGVAAGRPPPESPVPGSGATLDTRRLSSHDRQQGGQASRRTARSRWTGCPRYRSVRIAPEVHPVRPDCGGHRLTSWLAPLASWPMPPPDQTNEIDDTTSTETTTPPAALAGTPPRTGPQCASSISSPWSAVAPFWCAAPPSPSRGPSSSEPISRFRSDVNRTRALIRLGDGYRIDQCCDVVAAPPHFPASSCPNSLDRGPQRHHCRLPGGFSSTYVARSHQAANTFTMSLDHMRALYFTITVFSTVGSVTSHRIHYGARLVVAAQMLLDLVLIEPAVVRDHLQRRSKPVGRRPTPLGLVATPL